MGRVGAPPSELETYGSPAPTAADHGLAGAAVPLVLGGISLCYTWAFGSLYVQLPGLYGGQGVLPADIVLAREAPALASARARYLSWNDLAFEMLK